MDKRIVEHYKKCEENTAIAGYWTRCELEKGYADIVDFDGTYLFAASAPQRIDGSSFRFVTC